LPAPSCAAVIRTPHRWPCQPSPPEVPNPFQASTNRPTVPVLTADGQSVGRRHIVKRLIHMAIDQN
jgi:hypothetical protein